MPRTQRRPRVRYDALVEIHWASATFEARVFDISPEGLFLEVSAPFWVEATFSANLMIQPPLRMNCTVRRIVPNRGIGVQVTFTNSEASKRFAELVEKLYRAL